MVRIGAYVPSYRPLPARPGFCDMGARAEAEGFDSVWVSDHVVIPDATASPYPFSETRKVTYRETDDWFDAVVAMSFLAASTRRVELGVGVLVLPLRHPLLVAKQVASLDRQAGGRVILGVGTGWLSEEYDALGVPFASRGARLDEQLTLLRAAWGGVVEPVEGRHFRVPAKVHANPTPQRHVPVVVGGMSRTALGRAAREDGWFALQRTDALDPEEIRRGVETMRGEGAVCTRTAACHRPGGAAGPDAARARRGRGSPMSSSTSTSSSWTVRVARWPY